jgi:hypothetical protein
MKIKMKKILCVLMLFVGLVMGLASCKKVEVLPQTKPITTTKNGKNKLMIANPEPLPIVKEVINN